MTHTFSYLNIISARPGINVSTVNDNLTLLVCDFRYEVKIC